MDNIEKLCEEIRSCRDVWFFDGKRGEERVPFSGLVNDAAQIFERNSPDSFGVTRLFLTDKLGRRQSDWRVPIQAAALLKVLEIMGPYPEVHTRPSVGRLIIKTLPSWRPSRR